MLIHSFRFSKPSSGWSLAPTKFSQLSLLVGLSGAGKTRILRSLANLGPVATGGSLDGVEWEVSFTIAGVDYVWSGEFEHLGYDLRDVIHQGERGYGGDKNTDLKKPNLLHERLVIDGIAVAQRTPDSVAFGSNWTLPKLSKDVSLIKLFSEEELIRPVFESFGSMKFLGPDHIHSDLIFYPSDEEFDFCKKRSETEIQNLSLTLAGKIFAAEQSQSPLFEELKARYVDIFPFVQDIKMMQLSGADIPSYFSKRRLPFVKEQGVHEWIPLMRLSSGMSKTLEHLANVIFSKAGTVFLIDEFENSLGANCVDSVTDFLIESGENKQFILTSHHPTVINSIDSSFWSIVERDGSKISVKHPEDLGIGKSHHEKYTQLMNSILWAK